MIIFKWELSQEKTIKEISMPEGAQILSMQLQRQRLCVWALCDETTKKTTLVEITCYGTGSPIPRNPWHDVYIDTIQFGDEVYHYFETNRRPLGIKS